MNEIPLKLDRMLLIGSTGANAGKTELACGVISKFSRNREIIGIKVTTIKAKDGKCPRGGTGCGVCSSLKDDFCITEETCSTSGKDTARLLAAGASRVFWLRVMKESLTEGINALFEIIPSDHDGGNLYDGVQIGRWDVPHPPNGRPGRKPEW